MGIVKCHSFLVSALTNLRAPPKMTVLQQTLKQYIESQSSALLYVFTFGISTSLQKVTTYIAGTENSFRGVTGTSKNPKKWVKTKLRCSDGKRN
jgi:hypothetical protein